MDAWTDVQALHNVIRYRDADGNRGCTQSLPPRKPPSLREVGRMIGAIGGHLGRNGDGEPGMTVLWRDWMRLQEDVLVLRAHKQALGLIDGG